MESEIKTTGLQPVETLQHPDLQRLAKQAANYLLSHSWCASIEQLLLAEAWEGILGVFLANIEPLANADPKLWVIVGDIPPIYLDTSSCRTPTEALETYVTLFREWVTAVRAKQPTEDLVPVTHANSTRPLEPSLENAEDLATRLDFIKARLLPETRPRG